MFGLGTTELIIILVIVVMLFGLGKLPQAAKQLGLGARSFQKGLKGELDEDDEPAPKELERTEEDGGDWAGKEVEKEGAEA